MRRIQSSKLIMYSTMFPEDCGKRDLFHFHLSQPRNISSLDKIKSMFCRFKKKSLVTSNFIYLMLQVYLYKYQILQLMLKMLYIWSCKTNIKSCNFFSCYFLLSSDMHTLMYYTYYAFRTRVYFLTVQKRESFVKIMYSNVFSQ